MFEMMRQALLPAKDSVELGQKPVSGHQGLYYQIHVLSVKITSERRRDRLSGKPEWCVDQKLW